MALVLADLLSRTKPEESAMTFLPNFDPAAFARGARIDNPYFILKPGTIQSYSGTVTDEDTGETHTEQNDFFATFETANIAGLKVFVVRDTAYDAGVLVEDTIDWFAQDKLGNVWYLGEKVNNYRYDEDGNFVETDHDGAWQAGVNNAKPGWIMQSHSKVGDSYFQEFSPGIAVDEALVSARNLTITVGDETYTKVLKIKETSELDPGIVGFKYYAPGVGLVRVDENVDASGQPEFVSELIGARSLQRTDQRGLQTPEADDFQGEGEPLYVKVLSSDTDANNALGAYTFDLKTGEIGEARILYDSIEDGGWIKAAGVEVEEGEGLGLFLVPNGGDLGLDLSDFDDGGLFFVNFATGKAATINDGMAPLIVDSHRQPLPIQAFHALGSGRGYNLLNPGAGINAIEWQREGGRGRDDEVERLKFEDTRVTDPEYDGDFDDLVVAVISRPISGDLWFD
jgi:hypothetical protein